MFLAVFGGIYRFLAVFNQFTTHGVPKTGFWLPET
jgi:hypothetical protein